MKRRRKELKQRRAEEAGRPRARRPQPPRPPDPWQGRRYPTKLPAILDGTTEAALQSLLPPGFHVYKDMFYARWLVSFDKKPFISRSWGKYGYGPSGALVAKTSWEMRESSGGDPCPIEGVMRQDS